MCFFSAAPILVLGNMDNEMIMAQSRESVDLRTIDLPGETVAAELEPEHKHGYSNKTRGDTQRSLPLGNTGRKVVSWELKDKLWAQATGREANEDHMKLAASSMACSISTGAANISSPAVGLSIMSRSRAKKRHDCAFDGCGFSTCYLKDLVRHVRRHTGTTRS
jgi:hypothetical protein